MHEFRIQQASLSCRWACTRLLPALPAPGSVWFGDLLKRLEPLGVTAQDLAVEAPGNRLSDVALTISFSRREILLRLTYTGFEIVAGRLLEEHVSVLPQLGDIAIGTLKAIDSEATKGRLLFSYTAHIALSPGVAEQILREQLGTGNGSLLPEVFGYRIQFEGRPEILNIRLVLARSLFYDHALFVDYAAEYSGMEASTLMTEKIGKDYYSSLERFGLRLAPGGQSANA